MGRGHCKSHDSFQEWGVVTVNHMNRDVAEVNSFDPRMLPGYEKEPGYEATAIQRGCSATALCIWSCRGATNTG